WGRVKPLVAAMGTASRRNASVYLFAILNLLHSKHCSKKTELKRDKTSVKGEVTRTGKAASLSCRYLSHREGKATVSGCTLCVAANDGARRIALFKDKLVR
ncbi:MAG: hypothetical protein ABJN03_03105, partial [Ascidiaceihabitans sp.]|uniref:hypothetical protein n=1 Tax=Rhodobacterales TaxID=204455 RepID=UPI00329A1AA0